MILPENLTCQKRDPNASGSPWKKKDQAVNLDTLGLEIGNKPPQALDVEEAVLGALLVEPSIIDDAVGELTPECFYDPKHRMIFESVASLVREHAAVDLVTVSERLRSVGNLEIIGGPVALANLILYQDSQAEEYSERFDKGLLVYSQEVI